MEMNELKTSRPFQERFLDGFDRSELRNEVQKVKPRRLSGLRRKYAGWALGAPIGIFSAFVVSMIGTGVGMYYGRRIGQNIGA